MPILILTGGAIVTPEEEVTPPEDENLARKQVLWRAKPRRFLRRLPIYCPNNEPNPITPPPPTDCLLGTTNYFEAPFAMGYPLNRPRGSGLTFYPATHPWNQALHSRSGIVLNRSTSGYGGPLFDATLDSTVRTITRQGGGTGNGLPVTCPIPNNFGNIGQAGTDLSFDAYDGTNETWHDFWAYDRNNFTARAHYAYSGKQATLSPRGSCASGILFPITIVRAIDFGPGCRCQHALGMAVQGFGSSSDILANFRVWPATSMDTGSEANKGVVPYGAWAYLPLPSEGGPSDATLGVGAADTMLKRVVFQARYFGWVVVDQGANVILRADQTMAGGLDTQWVNAANVIFPYMRFASNVGTAGTNPIGGGSALASNCAYDRVTPEIKSIQWWVGRYSLTADYNSVITNDFIPGTTTRRGWDDSWKHYEKAFSFGGNTRMWQATGDNRYLDRVLLYTEGVVDAAAISSSLGPNGFGDSFLGWIGKTHPSGVIQEAPLYEFYCWRWIAMMLEEAYRRGMMASGTYATRLQAIQGFLEQQVFTKWWTRGVNSYIYRTVMHISAHAAIICLFLKNRGSTATIKSRASTILDNIDHLGQPGYGGPYNNLRSMFINHPYVSNPSSTAFWYAYFKDPPPPNTIPATDTNNGSDTSHAEAVVVYIDFAIQMGYGSWTVNDINKVINLWNVVWPNASTHYNWLRGPTAVNTPLTWTPNYNEFFGAAGYSRNQQIRMETFGGANQALYFGQGAYNSWKLGQP